MTAEQSKQGLAGHEPQCSLSFSDPIEDSTLEKLVISTARQFRNAIIDRGHFNWMWKWVVVVELFIVLGYTLVTIR
jgi:hypothetical protein